MATVLFFAQAASQIGLRELPWELHAPADEEAFWLWLQSLDPRAAQLRPFCRLARNGTYLRPGELLLPTDEIALIPPVSGG